MATSNTENESLLFSEDIRHYDLQHEIGVGSFGRVYEAEDRSTGRSCAVKRISKQNNPNPRKVQSEVEIHKRASAHENIIRLYRAMEDDKYVYLIMELCSGGSLKSLIRSTVENELKRSPEKNSPFSGYGSFRRSSLQFSLRNPSVSSHNSSYLSCPVLPYSVIRSVIRQLCHGLHYLHRSGVIHRDLNVNNILLESRIDIESQRGADEIRVKIADFGLAIDLRNNYKNVATSAVGNTICGTPGFISPEVWRQTTPVSSASDVFSLGSIIYAMITGVTSPKGNLDVSSFPPLLANLICSLLDENPDNRLGVKEILDHPFTLGPISTKRLQPTSIVAKNHRFDIHEDLSVSLSFLDKDCSIYVSQDSSVVTVHVRQNMKKYSLETLPKNRWKWYSRVHDFLRGIKSTTPKIKKFCTVNYSTQHKLLSLDSKGNRRTILGGVLSEAGTFKAYVVDEINSRHRKIQFNDKLRDENPLLYRQVKDLYDTCRKLEDTLESLGESELDEFFPFMCGRNPLKSCSKHDLDMKTKSMTLTKCVTIDDVESASKVDNGFQVKFVDGSSLTYFTNSQIAYCDFFRGEQTLYTASSHLPPIIQRKLAIIPSLINSSKLNTSHRLRPGLSHVSC